jgi:uridine kinase
LGQRPIALGVAGDSGVGKSTFSNSLASLFGENSTIEISGDDYHNWDRSSPMWAKQTHLDPRSNQLFEMVRDFRKLLNGYKVYAREYNHNTGTFMPRRMRKSSDVILINGLHAIYSKQMSEELDVGIFIKMEENLQNSLRIKRDMEKRGRNKKNIEEMISKRRPDYKKFIEPQAEKADIVFELMPINPGLINVNLNNLNLKLRALIRNGIYYQELVKILIGVCGLQVNIESINEKGEVLIELSGDVESEDIKLAAHLLLPEMDELLGYRKVFSNGVVGIMQIITLMEIDESLKRRKNN